MGQAEINLIIVLLRLNFHEHSEHGLLCLLSFGDSVSLGKRILAWDHHGVKRNYDADF